MTAFPAQVSKAMQSAKMLGRSKTEDHRLAIAVAQRRRHAACRVLRAVEEVRTVEAACHAEPPPRLVLLGLPARKCCYGLQKPRLIHCCRVAWHLVTAGPPDADVQ